MNKTHRISIGEENIMFILDVVNNRTCISIHVQHYLLTIPISSFILFNNNYLTTGEFGFFIRVTKMKSDPYWWIGGGNRPTEMEPECIGEWNFLGERQLSIRISPAKYTKLTNQIKKWKEKN